MVIQPFGDSIEFLSGISSLPIVRVGESGGQEGRANNEDSELPETRKCHIGDLPCWISRFGRLAVKGGGLFRFKEVKRRLGAKEHP